MKMGSLSAMVSLLLLRRGRQRGHGNEAVRGELGERHGVEHAADVGLDLLDGPPQIAARVLRAVVTFRHAAHDLDRPFEGPQHLPHRDGVGPPGQLVSALGPVVTGDESMLGESLEDLGEEFGRNVELLGDALSAHRTFVAMTGDVVHRDEPIVRALRESQHVPDPSWLPVVQRSTKQYPTKVISDSYSRSLPSARGAVKS